MALLALVVIIRPGPDVRLSAADEPIAEPPTMRSSTVHAPQRPAARLAPSRATGKTPETIFRSTGRLTVVPGSAKAQQSANKLTYRLEIEQGLPFDGASVAAAVHRSLTDARGWQSVRRVHFERVGSGDADLRIILATPAFTDRLCRPLLTRGEVSCRVDDRVVLNAKRWAYGIPDYAGKLDLYRAYVVNHEVGHALGYGHSTCTTPGRPAPVMMQQTKGLFGCLPNPWPTVKAT